MKIFEKFLNFQKKYRYIEQGDKILVAFSGGPDSVFLVEMLSQLQKILFFEIVLVHLHHGIREEAEEDYCFCQEYAKRKGFDCVLERTDVPSYAKEHKKSLEEAGRELRYDLFARVKKEKKCNKIATAHHLDDHLETFFFRLLRGTSLEGLQGIGRKQGKLIRPLRDFEKEEILEYLNRKKIFYCQDKSNEEITYTRNKIRKMLLPQFAEYNPKWKEKILALTEEISEHNRQEKPVLEKYRDEKEADKISVIKLQKEEEYFQKKILYHYLLSKQISTNRKQIDKIYTLLQKGGSLSYDLKNACKFKKEYDRIWIQFPEGSQIERKEETREVPIPGAVSFGNYQISTYILDKETEEDLPFLFFWTEGERLTVRNYRSGDRIQLSKVKGPKKVKEILIDLKIPREKRKELPILEYEGKILFLANLRRSFQTRDREKKLVKVIIEEVRH